MELPELGFTETQSMQVPLEILPFLRSEPGETFRHALLLDLLEQAARYLEQAGQDANGDEVSAWRKRLIEYLDTADHVPPDRFLNARANADRPRRWRIHRPVRLPGTGRFRSTKFTRTQKGKCGVSSTGCTIIRESTMLPTTTWPVFEARGLPSILPLLKLDRSQIVGGSTG